MSDRSEATTARASSEHEPTEDELGRVLASLDRRTSKYVVGVLLIAIVTGYFVANGTSYSLFIFNSVLLAVIGATALNLLMGTAGLISLGNAALLTVGTFSAGMTVRIGVPFPLDILLAMVVGAAIGLIVGLPALRLQGLYLILATLALQFIVVRLAAEIQSAQVGASGYSLDPLGAGLSLIERQRLWAVVLAVVVTVVVAVCSALASGRTGRAWRMIRGNEIAATAIGIRAARFKLGVFMFTSALISMQGALAAHVTGFVTWTTYDIWVAIAYVAMVLIGGLDSVPGAVIGAAIVISLPFLTTEVTEMLAPEGSTIAEQSPQIAQIIYGALIVWFAIYAPNGLVGWFRRAKRWWQGRRPTVVVE
jgi:branched-chain amino acid transport system permease protein